MKQHRNWFYGFVIFWVILGFVPGHTSASAGLAPALACEPAWKKVASPAIIEYGGLNGVDAISPNDVWAVGYYFSAFERMLVLHFDGTSWQPTFFPISNPPNTNNVLYAVNGSSANDVWAVGSVQDSLSGQYQTLIIHWNGTKWSRVPSPNIGTAANELYSVLSIAANDAWAVGQYQTDTANRALTLHWDGSSWTSITTPDAAKYLRGVTAVSSTDVWAVGIETVLHWNGSSWILVPGPATNPATFVNLASVSAVTASDIWSAGFHFVDPVHQPLAAHWNGTDWQAVSTPGNINMSQGLSGIAAVSTDNVWAVGTTFDPDTFSQTTLAMKWNGSAWRLVPSPNPDKGSDVLGARNTLKGITNISGQEFWAVGDYRNVNGILAPLIIRATIPKGVPVKPILIAPQNGETVSNQSVLLDWDDTNCAKRFELTVRRDSKTGPVMQSKTKLTSSQFQTKVLPFGHTYFWQVRACNTAGCGKWSKWFSFVLQP